MKKYNVYWGYAAVFVWGLNFILGLVGLDWAFAAACFTACFNQLVIIGYKTKRLNPSSKK